MRSRPLEYTLVMLTDRRVHSPANDSACDRDLLTVGLSFWLALFIDEPRIAPCTIGDAVATGCCLGNRGRAKNFARRCVAFRKGSRRRPRDWCSKLGSGSPFTNRNDPATVAASAQSRVRSDRLSHASGAGIDFEPRDFYSI